VGGSRPYVTSRRQSDSIGGMEVTRSIAETRRALAEVRRGGRRITFVPTMGALHVAHVSLMAAAKRDGGYLVVSIFVNPTQFPPGEDFERYPRDEAGDLKTCQQAGVELVFIPPTEEMYRQGATTTVHVAGLTDTLCGPRRPGHFDGVALVVAKLFNIVQPDVAYFGEKDFQQLQVIRRMVRDLDMAIEIIGCPTVREADGLAVSSRNAYLSQSERQQAASLYRALCDARARIRSGERDPAALSDHVRRIMDAGGPAQIDYISVVDPESMQPVERIEEPVLIALAVKIGPARLIDNLLVDPRAAAD
jgi:pantoate--beta-alanine ligase